MNEKFCVLVKISLKFVPKGPIDNKLALVMACRRLFAPSHYPNQCWSSSLTHVYTCGTRAGEMRLYIQVCGYNWEQSILYQNTIRTPFKWNWNETIMTFIFCPSFIFVHLINHRTDQNHTNRQTLKTDILDLHEIWISVEKSLVWVGLHQSLN